LLDPLTSREPFFIDAGAAEISTELQHVLLLLQQSSFNGHNVNLFQVMHCSSPWTTLSANLTFIGPCIVIYSYNESQRDALFLKFI
jgi:hypothetical protein